MKSKNELKEIGIKNRVSYYFDDVINGTKNSFSNNLFNEKLYENISIYKISYKSITAPKALRIRFDKTDAFIISLDRKIKHLVLFDYGNLVKIYGKIKYLTSKKVVLQIVFINHNFGKIRIDSNNFLPIERILTFHNVIIRMKSVVNKTENKYYYKIFLEKASCKYRFQ